MGSTVHPVPEVNESFGPVSLESSVIAAQCFHTWAACQYLTSIALAYSELISSLGPIAYAQPVATAEVVASTLNQTQIMIGDNNHRLGHRPTAVCCPNYDLW